MTYDAIFSHLPATRPLHLLDIGCSTCTEGQQLLDRGITLTGIDQDGATLDEVRARLPGATFLTMNAADLEASERFDFILLRLPDLVLGARNWRQVFRRLGRWLAPDGKVVITTPGRTEAGLAQYWLDQDGAKKVVQTMTNHEDERYMLLAEGLEEQQAEEDRGTATIHNLMWSDDDGPAMACDVKTGTCSPVQEQHA